MENSGGKEGKSILWLGGVLTVAGSLVLAGYGIYYFFQEFAGDSDIPLPVRVSVAAVGAGMLVLLGAVAMEQLRHRKQERFKEMEY
jgi:hypothetical protein